MAVAKIHPDFKPTEAMLREQSRIRRGADKRDEQLAEEDIEDEDQGGDGQ